MRSLWNDSEGVVALGTCVARVSMGTVHVLTQISILEDFFEV